MNPAVSALEDINRLQRTALLVGVVALLAVIAGAFFDSAQFFRSYLFAYVFWVSFALGSLGIIMLHNLVGGKWGVVIRKFLESGMRTLPLMAILVIPILVGIPTLYHWAHHEVVQKDVILQHKEPYLNIPFFIGRTVAYFAIWIALSFLLGRSHGRDFEEKKRAISGPGLIIFMFTVTFAGVDWIMSLEPHWFSTMYGAIFVVGQALQIIAFCIAILALLHDKKPFAGIIDSSHFHDLGNLTLAFTVLWAYTSFSQFLIIWSGNIPEETPWYLRRSHGGWQFIALLLSVFHFVVPFFILLSRFVKQRGRLLARVAIAIILVRMLDLFYWIEPAFHETGFSLHWMHIAAPIALGGFWVAMFLYNLKQAPLLNENDPRLHVEAVH